MGQPRQHPRATLGRLIEEDAIGVPVVRHQLAVELAVLELEARGDPVLERIGRLAIVLALSSVAKDMISALRRSSTNGTTAANCPLSPVVSPFSDAMLFGSLLDQRPSKLRRKPSSAAFLRRRQPRLIRRGVAVGA